MYELPTAFVPPKDFHVVEHGSLPAFNNGYVELFDKVIACYPVPSHFAANLDIKGAVSEYPDFSVEREIDRTTQQELVTVRKMVTEYITVFFTALKSWGISSRRLQLMRSLEKRSQVRVMRGLTFLTEQESHLKNVLDAQQQMFDVEVQLNTARLGLLSICEDDQRMEVDQFLKQLMEKIFYLR